MTKKWLSAYNLKYPHYIVYMLQASEYKVGAYLEWYKNLKSFHKVEVRKTLVKTSKSTLLLVLAWVITLTTLIFAVTLHLYNRSLLSFIEGLILIILYPYILAYGIIIPLFLIRIIVQRPIEYFIIKNAKVKLQNHKAIKIAVAGSFGKTTMREILKTVLSSGRKVAAPPQNHNTLLGISNFIKSLKGDEEILIFELGEYYKGDIKEMCELVNPSIGVITGINEAHLEKFKNIETTVSTIFELSDWLAGKNIYINGENKLAKDNAQIGQILYTREGIDNFKVENPHTDLNGTSFDLEINNKKYKFHSKLLGLHQIGPILVGIQMAINFGISVEEIIESVKNTKPFDHRLEPKIDMNGVTTLDDSYNGNPDGVKVVIEFLASLVGHRRIYITPGLVEMGNRTKEVHLEIGRQLARGKIEKVILVRNSVTHYIEQGLKESNYEGGVIWFEDSLKVFQALPHLTVSGDVVLLQNDWPDQYY